MKGTPRFEVRQALFGTMNEARAFAFWSFYVVVITGLVLISTSLPTKVGPTWGRREKK